MTEAHPAGPLPADIRRHLATAWLGRRIYFHPETDSTNDVALELARRGEEEGTVVVADYQRRGRGRRGHEWSSPRGRDLLVSIVLRPGGDPRGTLPVTLVVATAISVALSKRLDVEVGVKWPNDVVAPAGKVAGILAEASGSSGGVSHVVVGIGINVNSDAADFPPGMHGPPASCRTLSGVEWDRAELLADVLGTVEAYYDRFRRDGFAPLRGAYEARLCQKDRSVAYERDGIVVRGRALGVAPDGALRVALEGAGDVLLYNESVEVQP